LNSLAIIDESKPLYLYINTQYFQKKQEVEQWAKTVQELKVCVDHSSSELVQRFLNITETLLSDMLSTYGIVKIGYTSQKCCQVSYLECFYSHYIMYAYLHNNKLQERANTYNLYTDTIFIPCAMRFTPEIGKLIETFCFGNLKSLGLKIYEDR
jgi:hypothetical protein